MIQLIYIDLFCGGGGTTTGVHNARIDGESCAIVAACINHDENAIRSHKSNHKQTLHFTEDITLLYKTNRMQRLVSHVEHLKTLYSDAKVVLWASLECTNFSKAKGGQSRDADSRTLADHLFFYIEALQPDAIQIENVEEFMSWGPLDDNGKPVSKTAGTHYIRWINQVKSFGYHFQHRILNAADFGALTSRKRYFGQFCRIGEQICWPEQTHAEKPENDLFGRRLEKWRAVKEVLDFSDEGESIFDRKKPLVDATLERIYAGMVKFVAGGKKEFLLKYNSMSRQRKYVAPGIDQPCPTVSCQNRLGICNVQFVSKAFSGKPEGKVKSVDSPAGSITTVDHHQLINVQFISAYHKSGNNVHSVDRPSPAVCVADVLSLVQANFIDQQYGTGTPASIDKPAGTLTTNPKLSLVGIKWVMNTNFNNVGSSIDKPAQVITANRKHHYLLNPQFNSAGGSVDNPCFTLIARMDKMPPYLVDAVTDLAKIPSFIKKGDNGLVYEIYDTDSDIMVKIKEFMAMYGINDIKMRMLRILELLKIMGFPEDYILIGTQADQKKFIGNAVEVHMATAIVEATAIGFSQKMIAA